MVDVRWVVGNLCIFWTRVFRTCERLVARSGTAPYFVAGSFAALALLGWLAFRLARRSPPSPDSPRSIGAPGEATSDARLELNVVTAGHQAERFAFDDTAPVTVGRKPANAISLQHDNGVSGSHLSITFDAQARAWMVADLGSLNGTFVNSVRVKPALHGAGFPLRNGDRISVGEETILEVTCTPSPEAALYASILADVLSSDLLLQLRTHPLRHDIIRTLNSFEFPALRARGTSLQKQSAPNTFKTGNEDTVSHFTPASSPAMAALCVCDGHCGGVTSAQVQQMLPDTLAQSLTDHGAVSADGAVASERLHAALQHTFATLDTQVTGEDGCTMSLLLLFPGRKDSVNVCAANVGDSAVVCADFVKMIKMQLTGTHRVTNPTELARLKSTNSMLTHGGTRVMGLNLSRTIGDKDLKGRNQGILCEPFVSKVHAVGRTDSLVLVAASDGLWDVTDSGMVMGITRSVLAHAPGDTELLAQVLMQHAITRESKDDITISVLCVGPDQAP